MLDRLTARWLAATSKFLLSLCILVFGSAALATVTVNYTLNNWAGYLYWGNASPARLFVFQQPSQITNGDGNNYTAAYNNGVGTNDITGGGSGSFTVPSNGGYLSFSFYNYNAAMGALHCTTTPYDYGTSTGNIANNGSVSITINCDPVPTAPVLQSAAIDSTGTTLTLTYDQSVSTYSSIASNAHYQVTVGGVSDTVTSHNITGSTVVLGLQNVANIGQSASVSYTGDTGAVGTCDIKNDTNTFCAANFSGQTITNNSTAGAATVPDAPTIGTATAGNAQATVTFTAPGSDGGSAITTYTATANSGGHTGTCSGPSACTITVTGLTNGTAYTFTVTATNAVGTSSASSASNSVTPKGNQTITFAQPAAQNFGTSPTLGATASSGLTPTFSSSTTGVCTISSGGALTFVTTGTCTINADQSGNGSFNAAPTVSHSFTVNAVVPGAPTIGTATAGDAQATVTFTAPGSNGGAAITTYTATASGAGGQTGTCSGPAACTITVTGLTNGTSYTFTVTATNSAGTGSASAASNAVTPKANQTITFTQPAAQNFGTSPTLSATASSTLTPTFTSSTTGVCTITTGGTLTFVTAGTCTINADQAGSASVAVAPTVSRSFAVNAVVPGAPTIGSAAAGVGQATVTFTAPAFNGGSAITSYTATASGAGAQTGTCAGPAACTITVNGLTNGVSYTFTVTATNVAGTGATSAASNSVIPNPGPAVVSVAVPANGSYRAGQNLDFTITWDQAATVTGTPNLALTIGATTVQAGYVSSPTASTSLFRYTVLPGQTDTDGITIGALTLNGGSIAGSNGVAATLSLNSVGSTTNILVDTTAPTLPAANIVVNNQGDPHKVVLTFSEALNSGTLGSAGSWTVTANAGTPAYAVAGVALTGGNQVTLTLNGVDVANAATTITNAAANGHLKITPPNTLADLAGNTYAAGLVTEAGATHLLDSTPPTLSAIATSGLNQTGATLNATSSEKTMLYWLAVAQGATAPTVNQTQAGVSYGAVTAVAHGSGALPGGLAGSITLTGLTANTTYDVYLVAQDAAGNLSVAASVTTLTTAPVPVPFVTLPAAPSVPGIGGLPSVLDMTRGAAPAISSCLMDTVRQMLGGNPVYLGQTATGEVRVALNGQIIAFYPLSATQTDNRTVGVHPQSTNPLDVVTSCGTLNVTPALFNPVGFGAQLLSMGLTAQIDAQGLIIVLINGVYHVGRPDFVVTPGQPGGPSLAMGSDGLFRFIDSNGNSQIIRPAVLDPAALQAQISLLGGAMVVQLDGTVLMAAGVSPEKVLTPDYALGLIPSREQGINWWQDSATHYSYSILTRPYTALRQGVTFAVKP